MPWTELSPMDQRVQFIAEYSRGLSSLTELCLGYGISRKSGYKWIQRYRAEGASGLLDRSRRPHHSPLATAPEVVAELLRLRRRHPHWGARKLLVLIARQHPDWPLPHPSTACDILRRHGLVRRRRLRRKPPHPGPPQSRATQSNQIWTADFKGEFKTRDGRYCYPLTIADHFSRFLLGCRGFPHPSYPLTQGAFKRLFQEFGLPEVIRTDNGTPFASTAIGRLSRLSVWWIRLGIRPELIQPAQPQQNARHERFHRTLKEEAATPPSTSLSAQQRRFDQFRKRFNQVRPHQALADQTPASLYEPSPRPYPERLPALEYPAHFEVRKVSSNGSFTWKGQHLSLSRVLCLEYIGLCETADGFWEIYLGPVRLALLNEPTLKIEDAFIRPQPGEVLPMSPD